MTLDPLVFGRRLRHFRRTKNMTLDDLGQTIGRPAPYLSLVENGKRDVKLGQITALADAVGVSVAELLEDAAPDRRSDLEIRLERAQEHPVYRRLGLPHLKPTAKTPDDVLEHLLALYEVAAVDTPVRTATTDDLRRASADCARHLGDADGRLPDVEAAASRLLEDAGVDATGPLTTRDLTTLADHVGYRVLAVDDIPKSVRSIVDETRKRIYVAQRNELRTRQARKAILQTLAHRALGHGEPSSPFDMLWQRVETAYFAAAVLVPERSAQAFLQTAKAERDISIEDLKERFYVSYEMAAQRFTNVATSGLGIRCHFIRSRDDGTVVKAYANDDAPLPRDAFGGSEGLRLCRQFSARTAYESERGYDLYSQFTDTPAGSFLCSTHLEAGGDGDAFTVGVRFADARYFRARRTDQHRISKCPKGECCHRPAENAYVPGIVVHPRIQDRLVSVLVPSLDPPVDSAEIAEFAERHDVEETSSLFDELQ
jgi:transcriptional regulator with XRE-family HTH domain/predicted transcriptional regulator